MLGIIAGLFTVNGRSVRSSETVSWRSRLAGFAPVLLLPPAAFVVHQMRFMLAFGSAAGVELQRTGHSYLSSAVPWLVLLLALAVGVFLRAVGRALVGHTSLPRYTVSLTGLWFLCSAALVAIYVSQEFLEGLFANGHPAGLAGIFAYGGWWAIPSAIIVGLVLAAVFHGARWVLGEVAKRRARPVARRAVCLRTLTRPRQVRLAPLVAGWSGRGPPA
jgi:hypothetical protein